MPNIFDSIKLTKPNNNVFDLSHDVKLSLNMGELVPIMCTEAVPGDKFDISCESLLRFAPLVSPVFHRMDVTMHYFFVPNRLLWPAWEDYITNTKDPVSGLLPAFPYLEYSDAFNTRLMDYMGLPNPIVGQPAERVSALPFAAYQKIYDEYYRDQNMQPSQWVELVDGSNSGLTDLVALRNRAWEHDYFTSALPFAQKGDAVDIPLGTVQVDQAVLAANNAVTEWVDTGGSLYSNADLMTNNVGETVADIGGIQNNVAYDPKGTLEVEPTTINTLRRAFKLQEWLEKMARGGSRYIEVILSHFGVSSSDKRLQRPEYITGTKSPVVISEVVNTTGTVSAPQGEMAGHGIAVTSGSYGHYRCEEHGYIIGIMSVLPKTAYQQGIPKHFIKTTDPTEFYWPSFANLGEQEILNKELYAFQGNAGNSTFGYIPRYAEYRFESNRVAGDFRDSLDFWHLGRKFATPPALNAAFITSDPTHRVFAVTTPTVQKLYAHVLNKIRAVRPMPKYGTPTF